MSNEAPTTDAFPPITPKKSLVLFGPHGSRRHQFAQALQKSEGICEVDASKFFGDMNISSIEAVRKIQAQLESEQCKQGFALHHFPNNLPEEKALEKMLKKRFGEKHPFTQFDAVFLNVAREPVELRRSRGEPILEKDTPDFDPTDVSSKGVIGRQFTLGTSNWLHERPLFMDWFMKTKRGMVEVDALSKPAEETTKEILRIVGEHD